MKTLLLDDEQYCTDVLNLLIQKHCPSLQVVAIFNDPLLAIEYLKIYPVDLLFLDIEMPVVNGFELLRKLPNLQARVIFTTAYDQYALKAFRFNAVDYLLKPIDKSELIEAVSRVQKTSNISQTLALFLSELQNEQNPKKILLPIGNELVFVNVDQIICCEAEGSYCKVYCEGKSKPYLLSKNLKDIEEMILSSHFFRPHASWLINDLFITKVIKGEGMEIVLSNHICVPVARSKKQDVLLRLNI